MFAFVRRLCILLFWFLQSAIYSHYILETISLWNSHNPVGWITEHLQSLSRLPAAYLDLMFAAATSFCGFPRYCTLLFSWKTHTIKVCPLPAGTSKYNCYKGDVFVCNVLQEMLRHFQPNCRNLRSSSLGWIPLNKNQLQHRQEERNKHSSDCFMTPERRLIVQKLF